MEIEPGQVIGIAGGSGAGKSSLAMTMLRLYEPTSGSVFFEGQDITRRSSRDLKSFRRQAQIIFQDPYGSLNPRFTVARTVLEPLLVHGIGSRREQEARVNRVLELVELVPPQRFYNQYPHELSGGQRQRLSIARAMVLDARFVVADEPVSMLDVSIRAGIIALLQSLVQQFGLAVLYISHDIASMRYICTTVQIMYAGKIVETGPVEEVVQRPLHPYTKALISAVPEMEVGAQRARSSLKGEPLSPTAVPRGCRFRHQCAFAMDICAEEEPALMDVASGHSAACFLYAANTGGNGVASANPG
jgi:oligopeptide/dipeptide ABC transporter ATP-binding protein